VILLYELEKSERFDKDIRKLLNKNKPLQEALKKAIVKISLNPEHFKPLKSPLQNTRRVHVLGSFVLVFEIRGNTIRLLRFAHHDEAYQT
jgi:YafQ family addiction module toxin component